MERSVIGGAGQPPLRGGGTATTFETPRRRGGNATFRPTRQRPAPRSAQPRPTFRPGRWYGGLATSPPATLAQGGG